MTTCAQCHAAVPEGMRFCLQCGTPIADVGSVEINATNASTPLSTAPAPSAPPPAPAAVAPPVEPVRRPRPTPQSTIALRISPSPVIAPRTGAPLERPRPSLGRDLVEIDEELLKASFEKRSTQPGVVLCRFCRSPLDLAGDFCDVCGAPVADAAPPGTQSPKLQPAATVDPPPPDPDPALVKNPAAPTPPPLRPKPAQNAVAADPKYPTPLPPVPPPRAPAPASDDPQSGLMGRLKGLFKKS